MRDKLILVLAVAGAVAPPVWLQLSMLDGGQPVAGAVRPLVDLPTAAHDRPAQSPRQSARPPAAPARTARTRVRRVSRARTRPAALRAARRTTSVPPVVARTPARALAPQPPARPPTLRPARPKDTPVKQAPPVQETAPGEDRAGLVEEHDRDEAEQDRSGPGGGGEDRSGHGDGDGGDSSGPGSSGGGEGSG